MKPAENEASGAPETEARAGAATAAASAASAEPRGGRRASQRRPQPAVAPAESGGGATRVLRARGAAPGRTRQAARAESPAAANVRRRCSGRAARSRRGSAPVMQTQLKTPAARPPSSEAPGPRLARGRRSKKGSPSQASDGAPATPCKRETEAAASEEADGARRRNDGVAAAVEDETKDLLLGPVTKTEKSKRRAKTHREEVKKEEPGEEGGESIKEEEDGGGGGGARAVGGVGDRPEASRKRGRQDAKGPRPPKRRKKPPVQYVRCEMEGCGTVLAHPRYLQHHIKYQHLLKKKYVCDHPSCGRLFRLQKQLLRHAKHHTDQRDYICEYCARAFKSSHNLAVHRMIHTGEKPIQCEICGFTCRQKASLNWHMKKHDAEASYQFPCSICGKKFEKKDSVVAHKAKSHPEVLIAEAMAANGGSVISAAGEEPAPAEPPLQQVVLSLAPQTAAAQGLFLQLPAQQAPALLHLAPAPPPAAAGHPQLIQLSALPAVPSADSQGALLTLTPVAAAAPLPPPRDEQLAGEGELWDRVVVGEGAQDVGEVMWEGGGPAGKEGGAVVWGREGERQIVLQCAEVPADHLMATQSHGMNEEVIL